MPPCHPPLRVSASRSPGQVWIEFVPSISNMCVCVHVRAMDGWVMGIWLGLGVDVWVQILKVSNLEEGGGRDRL